MRYMMGLCLLVGCAGARADSIPVVVEVDGFGYGSSKVNTVVPIGSPGSVTFYEFAIPTGLEILDASVPGLLDLNPGVGGGNGFGGPPAGLFDPVVQVVMTPTAGSGEITYPDYLSFLTAHEGHTVFFEGNTPTLDLTVNGVPAPTVSAALPVLLGAVALRRRRGVAR